MVATKTSAQLSFLEQACRRVDRGEGAGVTSDASNATKTGVVFVHGIGSQAPGETLLQWSTPLIDLLTSWRVKARLEPVDPVVRAEINFADGLGAIELRVPPRPGTSEERTWILTEAWWASRVSQPSLSTMTAWLGPRGAAGRIVDGILANPAADGVATGGLIKFAQAVLVPSVSILAAIVLTMYALFRGIAGLIPIESVRNSALLKSFDTFLTGWFGDVRVILYDPAQSANIRAGLARSIRGLREEGCANVVVVAHSGGAMVSYLTLTDDALATVQVEKLITFGNGWNLALQLSPPHPLDGSGMADRLRWDITRSQPRLRWRDFWASNDPAPAGGVKASEIQGRPDLSRIRSGKIWNRRSLIDDHGTYWTNEEEFAIPVLQEIDVPTGWGEESMFFRPDGATGTADANDAAATAAAPGAPEAVPTPAWPYPDGLTPGPRAVRHRQRVAAFALLRQMILTVPVSLIAIALALKPERLVQIGQQTAEVLLRIPGVSNLNGPIQWLHTLKDTRIRIGSEHLGFDLIATMTYLGIATLQAIVLIAIAQLLVAQVFGFLAWPKGPARKAAAVLEASLSGLLIFGAGSIVIGDHDQLLGAGRDWIPGLALSLIVGVGAWGGSQLAKALARPAVTRAFGTIAALVFVTTILSAVVAIFDPVGLPSAEIGYVAIWTGAFLVFKMVGARWKHWDRLEQEIAKKPTGELPVNRWPAYLGALGVLVVAAAAGLAVLFEPAELLVFQTGVSPINDVPLVVALLLIGVVLFAASWIVGAGASKDIRDTGTAPRSVEAAY